METDPAHFEQLVADALDEIPEALGRMMENVVVLVEDWPSPEQLGGRRGTLLGLYQGVDLTRRSPLSYAAVMPDRITIFRGPSAAWPATRGSWSESSPPRSSTRSPTTSGSPTSASRSWAGRDGHPGGPGAINRLGSGGRRRYRSQRD